MTEDNTQGDGHPATTLGPSVVVASTSDGTSVVTGTSNGDVWTSGQAHIPSHPCCLLPARIRELARTMEDEAHAVTRESAYWQAVRKERIEFAKRLRALTGDR